MQTCSSDTRVQSDFRLICVDDYAKQRTRSFILLLVTLCVWIFKALHFIFVGFFLLLLFSCYFI